MHPTLFAMFLGERLPPISKWFETNGTLIGAITLSIIGTMATLHYLRRGRFELPLAKMKARPILTACAFVPVAALAVLALNKYLTFLSAAATTIGVLVALDNNRRSHEREEKRLARQEMAARTAFTHELSAICGYCEEVGDLLSVMRDTPPGEKEKFALVLKFPPIPPTASATIKEVIASTDNKMVAARCAQIQRYLQLIATHGRSKYNALSDTVSVQQMMRCVILYTITTSLFGFAREDEPELPAIEWTDIDWNTVQLGFDEDEGFKAHLAAAAAIQPDPVYYNSLRERLNK